MEENIGFIGAGHMAQAMANGFVISGATAPTKIWASAPTNRNLQYMKDKEFNVTNDNEVVVERCNILFLAVKPQIAVEAINSVKHKLTEDHLVVSVMAGVTLEALEKLLPSNTRVIRVIPNTPVAVREGVTVFARGRTAFDKDVQTVKSLMSTVGICEEVPEKLISAVGGMSGSGPAYVYLMMQAMADGGVKMGLPRHLATQFAVQTFLGASRMAQQCDKHLTVLQEEVSSPGGTTIHGLHQLELGSVRGSIMNAVQAATNRSNELSTVIAL